MNEQQNFKLQIAQDIGGFTLNPLGFVLYAFQWGKGELSAFDGPDTWQREHLASIGQRLKDGKLSATQAILEATASGHGVGKSCLVSWIILWAMSTCVDCRGVVTANTESQLKTKTWAELSKWHRLCICSEWFTLTATALYSNDPKHEKTWRIDQVPWSVNNTEAFAGMHNKGSRILVIMDEGSAIPDKIYEVTEGALTDSDTEILWLVYGNPTRNTGRFRECFGKFAHRWTTRHVDSREVKVTNKTQIQNWIDDYGEDSDFVRVRVRGQFPRAGSNQFIGSDIVDGCKKYVAEGFETSAIVFGVDVARFGDDQNAVSIRQGRKCFPIVKWRGVDTMQTASRIVELYEKHKPDMLFIDGGGVGGGVVDRVKQLIPAKKVTEVNFGCSADDSAKYFNKRAEMWGVMRDALKAGLQLPVDNELYDELTSVEYGFSNKQQIQLEKKEDMKARGLASPDCGDSLALTFAAKVFKEREAKPEYAEYYGSGRDTNSWMGG